MRLFKVLFVFGLTVYFCAIVISRIPAAWVAHTALKASPNLQLAGVTGTVWHGKATNAKITIDGKNIDLGRLDWKLKPLALLQMKACANVRSDLLNADLCRTAGGSNTLKNVIVDALPANILNDAMGAQLGGTGSVTVNHFTVSDDGHISALEGNLTWQGARINIGTGWFTLGSFGIGLTENGNGGLFADITDLEGEFKVNVRGDIKLREIPRLSGTIHPSDAAPNPIKQALSIFAEPLDDGGYKITWPIGG